MSDSSQPTARPPKGTGLGNVPSEMRMYMVLRDRPTLALTAGSLNMVYFIQTSLSVIGPLRSERSWAIWEKKGG
jgi:hypothetical protein